jgi:hypothetical protein
MEMGTLSARIGRTAVAGLVAALAAGAATAYVATGASGGSSMPAAAPFDAKAAGLKVINRTITPNPTTTRGFTGFQTVTIKPPANYVVLQGFATISGGNTASVVITSTSATPARYQVKLKFPGEQGKNGKLHVKVQVMPKL